MKIPIVEYEYSVNNWTLIDIAPVLPIGAAASDENKGLLVKVTGTQNLMITPM